jgi:hypothetical protein
VDRSKIARRYHGIGVEGKFSFTNAALNVKLATSRVAPFITLFEQVGDESVLFGFLAVP